MKSIDYTKRDVYVIKTLTTDYSQRDARGQRVQNVYILKYVRDLNTYGSTPRCTDHIVNAKQWNSSKGAESGIARQLVRFDKRIARILQQESRFNGSTEYRDAQVIVAKAELKRFKDSAVVVKTVYDPLDLADVYQGGGRKPQVKLHGTKAQHCSGCGMNLKIIPHIRIGDYGNKSNLCFFCISKAAKEIEQQVAKIDPAILKALKGKKFLKNL